MTTWEPSLSDEFLDEIEDVDVLASALSEPHAPTDALRAQVLSDARLEGRFDRFKADAARLLDLTEEEAARMLDRIDDPASWYTSAIPTVRLVDLEGGPSVQDAIRGFVKIAQNVHFPEHEHVGEERVLILQGSIIDGRTGAIHRPGEIVIQAAGSSHDFTVRPGPDLVYLLVVDGGLRIGGELYGPDDPRV